MLVTLVASVDLLPWFYIRVAGLALSSDSEKLELFVAAWRIAAYSISACDCWWMWSDELSILL